MVQTTVLLATFFMSKGTYTILHVTSDAELFDPESVLWNKALSVSVDHSWSGLIAPEGRRFQFRMLWSAATIHVLFEAAFDSPIITHTSPDLTQKSMGLWERDVCEIFIAPDREEPRRYFEFEAAPNGEWLDVEIDLTSGERRSFWEYSSGMQTVSKINEVSFLTTLHIPFSAFGKTPVPGDVWLGNIFRCVGEEPDRGYLAWRPTMTEFPNFHVPEAFGQFIFTD